MGEVRITSFPTFSGEMPPASAYQTWVEDLWAAGGDGEGMTIAYVDSGADLTDPVTLAAIAGGINLVPGMNPNDLQDRVQHGSIVARIMLTLAPKAKLYPIRIFGDTTSTSNVVGAQGTLLAAEKGDLTNASIGSPNDDPAMRAAVDAHAMADKTLVASAGNSGDGQSETPELDYPGAYDYPICVGAWDRGLPDPVLDAVPPKPARYTDSNPNVDGVALGRVPGSWLEGTSFSGPVVTGLFACYMSLRRKNGLVQSDAANYGWFLDHLRQFPGYATPNPLTGYGAITMRPYQEARTLSVHATTGEATMNGQPVVWREQPINRDGHLLFWGREWAELLGLAVGYDPQMNRAWYRG